MRRRSTRLPDYDYSQPGWYAITICTHRRAESFGHVAGGEMRLNAQARIVEDCWSQIPTHFPQVDIDAFAVMPNHMHGIVVINELGDEIGGMPSSPGALETPRPAPRSLPAIVASFKSAVSRGINALRGTPGAPVWQRGYHERVIRNKRELNALREYIVENPLKWDLDRQNPKNITKRRPRRR